MVTSIALIGMMALSASSLLAGEVTLVSEGHLFTEGPVWIAGEGLIFSDVVANTIYDENHNEYRKPSHRSNGLALDSKGRLVACESELKRITRTEKDGTITVLADKFDGKTLNSTNDIATRSDGSIYFTDPGATKRTELDVNGVYRIDPKDNTLTRVSQSGRFPNGIGFSPDEKTLYVGDYMGAIIRAFDVEEDGSLSHERTFCKVANPDGFAIDATGNLWTSSRSGISVFNKNGKLLEEIAVPFQPTNCCFGGKDGKTLFITARRKVYKVETTVKGTGKY